MSGLALYSELVSSLSCLVVGPSGTTHESAFRAMPYSPALAV